MGMSTPHMYLWLVLGEKRHRARALVRSYLDHVRGDTGCGAQSWGEECTAGVSSNQSGAPVRGQRRMSREHMSVSKCARPGVSVRWCDRICSARAETGGVAQGWGHECHSQSSHTNSHKPASIAWGSVMRACVNSLLGRRSWSWNHFVGNIKASRV